VAKITRLVASRDRNKRVRVFLDGKYAFSLEAEVVLEKGLRPGQELGEACIEALARDNQLKRALSAASRFIAYRPRSEQELRQRLVRRGFDAATVSAALSRLREQGLLDDAAFARYWTENRQSFSPRSLRLTQLELRQKGVKAEFIDQATGVIDDGESAYRAALKKAGRLHEPDYQGFRRKLGEYLQRRGFGYEAINSAVKRLWQEKVEHNE